MTAEFENQTQAINWAIDLLRKEGFTVRLPEEDASWITLSELSAKTGLSGPALSQRLKHRLCPAFNVRHSTPGGATGRIIKVEVSELLMAFVSQWRGNGFALKAP